MTSIGKVSGWAVILALVIAVSTPVVQASPRATAKDGLIEDFEDGDLDAYRYTVFGKGEARSAVVERNGNRLLHHNQEALPWTSAWIKDRTFKDFTIEVDVKKPALYQGYAGVILRNNVRVFFRQKGVVVLTGNNRSLAQSITGFPITKFHRLKVVCVGPIMRVYVNGKVIIEVSNKAFDKAGPIAMTSLATSAYFDNLRIDPNVAPEECVTLEPWAEDEALVFAPDTDLLLKLKAGNFSKVDQRVAYEIQVRAWDDKPLAPPRKGDIIIKAGAEPMTTVSLGRFPEGYYKIVVTISCGKRKPTPATFPLAVHERKPITWKKPFIPRAPYWAYKVLDHKPIVKKTYLHAAANLLRKHHFNAVTAGIGIDKVQVEVFREYGLAVITRGLKCIDEPNVIAGLIGDEPRQDDIQDYKKKYDEMRAKTDKPLTTCMIGEALFHALDYWKILKPDLRAFRWYGFKKSYYGLRRRLDYKNWFSFVDTLVVASHDPTPYWVILPSFGTIAVHGYYRDPLPCELQAMMHLSMAHNASGLLFYTLQRERADWSAFVDAVSLQPLDGKLAAVGEVNRLIGENEELLTKLRKGGLAVRTDSYAVELQGLDVPGPDAEEKAAKGLVENNYFYAVNIDNARTEKCRIFNLPPKAHYTDIYTGREFTAKEEVVELRPGSSYKTGVIRVALKPGEGMLVKVQQRWKQPDPIAWPEWLAKVPADKVLWLIDLPVRNKPQPGWMPNRKNSWKKKTWVEVNGATTLYADLHSPLGITCPKSLYGQAETTIVYDIPDGCTKFVAAAGLGTRNVASSLVFRVLVDGKPKYTSKVYRCGDAIIPLVVDITGGKTLTLVTLPTDDGIGFDYGWWGDARLIRR